VPCRTLQNSCLRPCKHDTKPYESARELQCKRSAAARALPSACWRRSRPAPRRMAATHPKRAPPAAAPRMQGLAGTLAGNVPTCHQPPRCTNVLLSCTLRLADAPTHARRRGSPSSGPRPKPAAARPRPRGGTRAGLPRSPEPLALRRAGGPGLLVTACVQRPPPSRRGHRMSGQGCAASGMR
jgi:hypothetical protein